MLTIAIVGRPNVGKSTLYNRLTGTKHAIVDNRAGVTRDRRYGDASIADLHFQVIDTAGMEDTKDKQALESRMLDMTSAAVDEADIILLLTDAISGITPEDEHFARWLRKQNKVIILVVNKAERKQSAAAIAQAWELGLGEPIAISAEHGEGLADLYAAIKEKSNAIKPHCYNDNEKNQIADNESVLNLAIIGRPNVGKSTLLNAMLGENRVLAGPEAGLTRDAIAVSWQWRDHAIKLVDTAGVRRNAKRRDKLERLAAIDSMRAIQYAHIVILLLDATAPLDKQDLRLAETVIEEGRGIVIAVNKWDLVTDEAAWMSALDKIISSRLSAIKGVPVVTLSALQKQGLDNLMEQVFTIYELWNKRISTGQLNRWLEGMLISHPPPLSPDKRPIRLKYITQIKTRPPSFTLFATRKEKLPESYRRYLINGIRKAFDLPAVPIRLQLKASANPYDSRK